jgi:hypothetical protein
MHARHSSGDEKGDDVFHHQMVFEQKKKHILNKSMQKVCRRHSFGTFSATFGQIIFPRPQNKSSAPSACFVKLRKFGEDDR